MGEGGTGVDKELESGTEGEKERDTAVDKFKNLGVLFEYFGEKTPGL